MTESTHISNLQTELKYLDSFKCYNILTDLGGYLDGVGEWGCGWVLVYRVPHASTHVHACMHVCTHICTCMLNMINMDASMEAPICNY